MSTQNATSAIFAEVSGPHMGPGSNLPILAPFTGLGAMSQQTNFQGPNSALFQGPLILSEGQTVPFTVFLGGAVLVNSEDLRGRLEGRAERNGLFTQSLHIHLSGQQLIWVVGPQTGPMTEAQAKRVLEDAVREELPTANVVAFTSTSPSVPYASYANRWMQTPSMPWIGGDMRGLGLGIVGPDWRTRARRWLSKIGIVGPDWRGARGIIGPIDGLGDIFSDIARGATSVSADLVCSPVFQAAAANDIARRYGEEHARTFREAFRQATAFCSPGAVARMERRREEEEQRNTWLIGGGVVATALLILGVWYFGKDKKSNRRRGRRRNIVGPDWRKARRRNTNGLVGGRC